MKATAVFGPLFALLVGGCISDAPRDNPLDPANGINLSGRVERFYTTQAIEGAFLTLKPGNAAAKSDMNGAYIFNTLSRGRYTLSCTADGFVIDSLSLDLQQSEMVNFRLDALPHFTDINLTTQTSQSFLDFNNGTFVNLRVTADDDDDPTDVELVWYSIERFAFSDTLRREAPGIPTFSGRLTPEALGILNLNELIGHPIIFFVQDFPGAVVSSEEKSVSRFINEIATVVRPKSEVVTVPFEMVWNSVNLPFPFSYTIEIFRIDFVFEPILIIDNIPSDSTTFLIDEASGLLPSERYFWTVSVVDMLGNFSRSIENELTIEP